VAFDAVSSANGTTVNNYNISHTIGSGSDRLLTVGACTEDSGTTNPGDTPLSTVTYNGVSCTLSAEAIVRSGATAGAGTAYMLEVDLPSTGSYTVTVTHSGAINEYNSGAISWDDIAQQAPEVTGTQTTTSGTTIQQSVTTVTDGAILFTFASHGNGGTSTPDAGDERFDLSQSSATGTGYTETGGSAGSHTQGVTWSGGGNRSALAIIVFEVVGAAADTTGYPGYYLNKTNIVRSRHV
jgi:hypothetical protein